MQFRPWLDLVSVLLSAAVVQGAPPEPAVVDSARPGPAVVDGAPFVSAVDDTHRADITSSAAVPVFVYSTQANLNADDERTALEVARAVLSTASVDVVWTVCVPGTCLTPTPGALKVRIVSSPKGSEHDANLLGHSLINSQTGAGELATVFVDRTRRLAGELGIDHLVLLGRTIAHELGHLLLGTSAHSTKLMRAVWSYKELVGTDHDDWTLDPLDALAIRHRLASRGQRDG
jgi:hypothetical protein